jgi:hypothetical protein
MISAFLILVGLIVGFFWLTSLVVRLLSHY